MRKTKQTNHFRITMTTRTHVHLIILIIMTFTMNGFAQQRYTNSARLDTLKEVYQYMNAIGVQRPDIVLKQVVLETGWLRSYNARVRNNIMGWRYKGEWLVFKDWRACVDYCKAWQGRHYKGGNYYEFLINRGYCPESDYIKKVKSIKVAHLIN